MFKGFSSLVLGFFYKEIRAGGKCEPSPWATVLAGAGSSNTLPTTVHWQWASALLRWVHLEQGEPRPDPALVSARPDLADPKGRRCQGKRRFFGPSQKQWSLAQGYV